MQKETLVANIDRDLKETLESESNRIGLSLSKYVELILRYRDIDLVLKKMASSVTEG